MCIRDSIYSSELNVTLRSHICVINVKVKPKLCRFNKLESNTYVVGLLIVQIIWQDISGIIVLSNFIVSWESSALEYKILGVHLSDRA